MEQLEDAGPILKVSPVIPKKRSLNLQDLYTYQPGRRILKEQEELGRRKRENKMYKRRDEVDWDALEKHRRKFAEKTDLYVRATFNSLASE